jgi:hypothetical protein
MTNQIKPPTRNRISPEFTLATKIIGFFTASIIMTGFLQVMGVIDFRGTLLPYFEQSSVYNIDTEAVIGVPYTYDFSWMKPPECFEPCHFETTAMEGFVPLGLQLWPDGILKGTPTGKSSSFEVCVIDAAGYKNACRKFNQTVNSGVNSPASGSGVVSTKGSADVWSGTYSYALNFDNQGPTPPYGDKFTLSFSRNGNNITGSYTQYSGGKSATENIIGTIVGTQIKFNDDWCPATNMQASTCFRFAGTISGNSINLNAERCTFNTFCPSHYTASSQNPAIKGTVTLTR